jgi:hypothetical protein
MYSKEFIEWLLFTDVRIGYNGHFGGIPDYWFNMNDVEDIKAYTLEEIYEYWIKNVKDEKKS